MNILQTRFHFRRLITILMSFALLFGYGRAAFARGGGGFGGHGGGFGGGHSFGGYRSSYGGYGGGYHSYGYGGGYYGGYYGGYHPYGYGYGMGSGTGIFFGIVAIVILLVIASAVMQQFQGTGSGSMRRSLVAITVVLQNGEIYTQNFASMAQSVNLSDPSMRTMAGHAIAERIDPTDVVYGCVTALQTSMDAAMLGAEAKAIWQNAMDAGEIHPEVMNVSSPGNKYSATFRPETGGAEAGLGPEGCCLATIIFTASGFWRSSVPNRSSAIAALHQLQSAQIDALYFTYSPSGGLAMSRNEALVTLNGIVTATGGAIA